VSILGLPGGGDEAGCVFREQIAGLEEFIGGGFDRGGVGGGGGVAFLNGGPGIVGGEAFGAGGAGAWMEGDRRPPSSLPSASTLGTSMVYGAPTRGGSWLMMPERRRASNSEP
jgi:hypothetical protein